MCVSIALWMKVCDSCKLLLNLVDLIFSFPRDWSDWTRFGNNCPPAPELLAATLGKRETWIAIFLWELLTRQGEKETCTAKMSFSSMHRGTETRRSSPLTVAKGSESHVLDPLEAGMYVPAVTANHGSGLLCPPRAPSYMTPSCDMRVS
jgi:hypothetical protein